MTAVRSSSVVLPAGIVSAPVTFFQVVSVESRYWRPGPKSLPLVAEPFTSDGVKLTGSADALFRLTSSTA